MKLPIDSLFALADLLRPCRDPWAIFGGAALSLHGVPTGPAKDIDVLLSLSDAKRIATQHKSANEASGSTERFRSQILLHPSLGTTPVELMAGFEVLTAEGWTPVRIEHRTTILVDGAALQVATLPELARLLRLFGRTKDWARLALISPPGV